MRLNVERFEQRELMAANLAASAVVREAPTGDSHVPAQVVVSFTPPIGSNKGSFAGDGFGVGLIVGGK